MDDSVSNVDPITNSSNNHLDEYVEYIKLLRTIYSASLGEYAAHSARINYEYAGLLKHVKSLDDELYTLRLSTSWRLTSPLRTFGKLIQMKVPGVAILAAHRQIFGIKAAIKRLIGFLLNWTGTELFNQSLASPRLRGSPFEPARVLSALRDLPELPFLESLEGRSFWNVVNAFSRPCSVGNILFISEDAQIPEYRYRIFQYVQAAQEIGITARLISTVDLSADLSSFDQYDILIIWRASWCEKLAAVTAYARARGKLVIVDIDEPVVNRETVKSDVADRREFETAIEDLSASRHEDIWRTTLAVDAGIAATERLAFQMREAGKSCYVLPDGFDQDMHDVSRRALRHWRLSKIDSLFRIGYLYCNTKTPLYLDLVINAVSRILTEYPQCVLVLFVDFNTNTYALDIEAYPALAGLKHRIEWRRLPLFEMRPFELARFDINLAPLEVADPFCESKSERQFFEAALVETPTIASPTNPFRKAIDHGKSGFLALGQEDWYSYIKALVEDSELRSRIGKEAYHGALAKFGPTERREKLARVLATLLGGREGAQAFALEAKLVGSRDRRPKVCDSEVVFNKEGDGSAQVSVVIPLYNYADYVIETLESVKAQNLVNLDLVVVDGFSADKSLLTALEWIQENNERFNRCILLKNSSNYGLALCRNTGIATVDTPYFIPVDADNRIRPRYCEALLETLQATKAAFAYSSIQQFGDADSVMGAVPYDPQRLVVDNYIDAMALVSKEAWAMIGGYEHIEGGWEDYDFWVRLAENGLFGVWRPEILADYRVHSQSMTQTQTLVPINRQHMNDIFKQRHPWVSLGPEQAALKLPRPPVLSNLSPSIAARFEKLLPILQCPKTKQKLIYDVKNEQLVSVDGTTRWNVRQGRPILITKSDIAFYTESLIDDDLPQHILNALHKTPGLALCLSAGKTQTKFGNFIQADADLFPHTDLVVKAASLPFTDNAFDFIVAANNLERYSDPKAVSAELRRVLKPDGELIVLFSSE